MKSHVMKVGWVVGIGVTIEIWPNNTYICNKYLNQKFKFSEIWYLNNYKHERQVN